MKRAVLVLIVVSALYAVAAHHLGRLAAEVAQGRAEKIDSIIDQ